MKAHPPQRRRRAPRAWRRRRRRCHHPRSQRAAYPPTQGPRLRGGHPIRAFAAFAFTLLLAVTIPAAPAQAADGCASAPDADGIYAFPADCFGTVPGGFGTPSDHFRFHVPERARVVFHVTNDATGWGETLLVDLTDPNGALMAAPNAGPGSTVRAGAVAEGPGVWQLRIDGFSMNDVQMPYRIVGRLEPAPPPAPPQNDCGTGRDAPASWNNLDVELPIACAGELRYSDDIDGYDNDAGDRYDFRVDAGDTVNVSLTLDPGASGCLVLFADGVPDECRSVRSGNETRTFTLSVGTDVASTGSIILTRIERTNATYAFNATLVPPLWAEQVATAHVDLGGPQPGSYGIVGPTRSFGPAGLPEGLYVAWIKLDKRAGPRDEISVTYASPYPAAHVRLVLADEHGYQVAACGTGEAPQTLRCDRSTDDNWDDHVSWGPAVWLGIVVERGVDIDATMTYRHWTRA